jgi:Matrixin
MTRNYWALMILLIAAVALQACGMRPNPQVSCNFVQNSDQQRVSWGAQTPVVLLIDSSVPGIYFDSMQSAARTWNEAVGREVIKVGGWTTSGPNALPDGVNLVYFQPRWDGAANEQARTTIYWSGSRIYEADIKINSQDFDFFAGDTGEAGKLDMESLMIHEFGHVLGLKHILTPGSVMAPTLSSAMATNLSAGFRRNLSTDDRKSIACEY